MARTLPWFRLYSESVDNPKLKLLAYEDRWHFIAILCCKCQGVIGRGDGDMTRRMVAVKLGLDLRELDEVARRLSEVGLIDPETFEPLAWDERQYKSDNSTERVREYRKRQQKQQSNKVKRDCNVSETAQETDTETDTEKDSAKADSKLSLNEKLWGGGLQTVMRLSGLERAKAASMLGKWRKDHGDQETLDAIIRAEKEAVSEPVAWITAALKAKGGNEADRFRGAL